MPWKFSKWFSKSNPSRIGNMVAAIVVAVIVLILGVVLWRTSPLAPLWLLASLAVILGAVLLYRWSIGFPARQFAGLLLIAALSLAGGAVFERQTGLPVFDLSWPLLLIIGLYCAVFLARWMINRNGTFDVWLEDQAAQDHSSWLRFAAQRVQKIREGNRYALLTRIFAGLLTLTVTYWLSHHTLSRLNDVFRERTKEVVIEDVRWKLAEMEDKDGNQTPFWLPVLRDFQESALGLGEDELPPALQGLTFDTLQDDDAQDQKLIEALIPLDSPTQNPDLYNEFDRFFGSWFPMQPILKERPLREQFIPKLTTLDTSQQTPYIIYMGEFYRGLKGRLPLQMIRWWNGWIQFFTLLAFFLAVLLLLHGLMLTIEEIITARALFPPQCRNPQTGETQTPELTLKRIEDQTQTLDRKPSSFTKSTLLQVYRTFSVTKDHSATMTMLQQWTQNAQKFLESGKGLVVYLAWSIPSLGFIGTVLGIGAALGGAGGMLTPDQGRQREVIEAVTLELGMAFDTTLVALLLSLALMLMIYSIRMVEEWKINSTEKKILKELITHLRAEIPTETMLEEVVTHLRAGLPTTTLLEEVVTLLRTEAPTETLLKELIAHLRAESSTTG